MACAVRAWRPLDRLVTEALLRNAASPSALIHQQGAMTIMPNEDTATPETKLTAMCERTIQQLDELSEKLDAYCRELESRAETPAETPVEM
jgi:hypothetical protein